MQPLIVSNIVAFVLMVVVSLVTPKTPYRIIKTWFAKDYKIEEAKAPEAQPQQVEA